ncbi:pentatricopeptide repeat-containing protein At2g26790, mitochondrial-like [Rhodamnia argentea]|uniref:Pentatricopeptide repeat-containing protein At2g26790, mitochondrial-like n=1 Tax=Rhodamnia argentea TaxID=178133 RepID=A0A8B8R4V8_9MYRT|nr:pentatricopeptide repeat-containing protein At2g26790, mitochondrial-like [Rhodamnia argentea]XP_048131108.1 pentatricopeptide repeat-containing protein At2g26790, mitochondrial-like [Rhodamnia argentea]
MWVSPAFARATTKLLSPFSFPKPKFLSASACLLDSDPPASAAAAVNRLQHQPDLAFSYFLHLDSCGFPLDPPAYASLISILSPSASRSRLDFVFSRLIASFHAARASAIPSLLDSLALLGGPRLLLRSIDLLVKAYVRAGRLDDAVDALFCFKRGALLPCVSTCNFLLNRLIESRNPAAAVTLYELLKRVDFVPNNYTYTIFIKALCRIGDLDGASRVLHHMVEAGVAPDSFAYATYIEGLCAHGVSHLAHQFLLHLRAAGVCMSVYAYTAVVRGFCAEMKLEEAEGVLVDMEEHGIIADVYCYTALIHGHCRTSNLPRALALHDFMLTKGIKSNCVVIGILLQCLSDMGMPDEAVHYFNKFKGSGIFLDEVTYNIAAAALCKLGQVEAAAELLEEMKGKQMALDIMHYTTLISGYCLRDDIYDALAVLHQMMEGGFQPDIVTYNVLARGFSRAGLVSDVHELLRRMDACGVKPNDVTHNMIIEGLCIAGKVEEAEVLFSGLQGKSAENKAAMFRGYCQASHLRKAFDLFMELSEAEKKSVKKNSCFKLLANLFVEGHRVMACDLLNEMSELDMEPTGVMYSILMAALCKAGLMINAQWLFDRWVGKGSTPDVATYTLMIDGYFHANQLQEALDLFNEMRNKGVEPDVIAYTVLLDGYSKVGLRKKRCLHGENEAQKVTGDSGANNVIKRLLLEMKDKIAPDAICYTVLIDRLCKRGNIEEAEDLLRDMIESGLQPDVVTYTSLISGCCSRGNMERAEYLYKEMLFKGIAPDMRTISVLVAELKPEKCR